ncbi:MAG: winged helix-turn-helix transcriptional regulator [Candidatus Latescibacteria bacterium]|nr:winged helix-turn-helix transcriptional regulator [Candidatus Latescibacterota bacterium]NIO29074.1 winged helix-turn-helix transcriptional regulator [Candidatus Latescibacterota bacterium]NIO56699.1 winged helix-turn-helix transcriptional regulator [Candidatus Latescibacterota bacterium]NIT02282.1 winged helix-turn-helix transcriptional regulator [Candidatus Latescibacterota bacterium]NIT39167.1 winged helix-turn-helix transcriptional regulator [Candidatus Latescibacterota bacterium]
MTADKLHPIDRQILEILQEEGRIPNVQLAAKVGLSPPAVLERVRKLEERGIIEKYVALVDNKKVGLGTVAFVAVSLNLHQKDSIENFHKFVGDCSDVLECHHLAGAEDYLLKIYSHDIDDYEDFLLNTLTRTKGIDKVRTMFVLSTLKKQTAVPLEWVKENLNPNEKIDGDRRGKRKRS